LVTPIEGYHLPRKHDNKDANKTAEYLAGLTKRAARDLGIPQNEEAILEELAVQEDELESQRDFETGSATFTVPIPSGVIVSPDRLAGLKRKRDQIAARYEQKEADLKYAGDKARSSANRNLDYLYAELLAANEAIDIAEAAMIEAGNLLACTSCGREFNRADSSFPDLCQNCEYKWMQPNNPEGTP
jgi:hypothetical protein